MLIQLLKYHETSHKIGVAPLRGFVAPLRDFVASRSIPLRASTGFSYIPSVEATGCSRFFSRFQNSSCKKKSISIRLEAKNRVRC